MNSTPIWKRPWVIILAVVLVIGAMGISSYNGFVTKSTLANTQWAQVETQYQRRLDLIPNLVNSAQAVMKQEQTVFTALADARTKYGQATSPDEKAQAASQVESSLGRLLVVMENYPQLTSSQNVLNVQAELAGTENRISVERSRYNDTVASYNLAVHRFPSSIMASLFGFKERALFQADANAAKAPTAFPQAQ